MTEKIWVYRLLGALILVFASVLFGWKKIMDVTEEMSKQYNMPVGVYIREVAEFSAAQRAGLQTADIIVEFAGEKVTCADDLNAIKAKQNSGDVVPMKIDRNGREVVLEIIIPQPTDVETTQNK